MSGRGNEPERILCAAVYIDTGKADPPRRSYTYPPTGLVFSAWRHGDCYTTMNAWLDALPEEERERLEKIQPGQTSGANQGFLTSKGRYVDRYAAWTIAYEAGQLLPNVAKWWEDNKGAQVTQALFSEDLY